MKLDPTILRTMSRSSLRVLSAVESGMQSGHYLVPVPLITSIANLRHGGCHRFLNDLLRDKLVSHDKSCGYDGYRLTNSGYDILALDNLKRRGVVSALGDKVGIGKESDVYLGVNAEGRQIVLKFHRLGRTSFRDVKKKRDYFMLNSVSKHKKRGGTFKPPPHSWLFLSRMSAVKEYAFMKALYGTKYPTPTPIGHNRHVVVMGLVRGVPLYQIHSNRISAEQAESIFRDSVTLAKRLAMHGLVHCDLNEFNLMVDMSGVQGTFMGDDVGEHYVRHSGMTVQTKGALSARTPLVHEYRDGTGEVITEEPPVPKELLDNGEPKPVVTLIDFPQMVSTKHPNAEELFDRDLQCLKRFFSCKLKCNPDGGWDDIMPQWENVINTQHKGGQHDQHDVNNNASNHGEEEEEQEQCLASKAQLRLDQDLQASGFSEEDSERNMELYYYENITAHQTIHNPNQHDIIDESNEDSPHEEHEETSSHSGEDNDHDLSNTQTQYEPITSNYVSDDEDDDSIDRKITQAESKARQKVRRHLDEQKKIKKNKGAFRHKNSNKTFVKGKRVSSDFGY
eukprot:CAMPEP_0172490168 /NCGR_PEP_ID=MMETSP1066-20121228/20491_1 /TAXON_ID=671091 /ORGANISM="Coscinodiscus wailesii, Strain CCMP2513" /LENGTH=563 /DNA_ID=CAMNT_0013258495 /DNA_START=73 /DNA_END=1764 /DNA_ORIENTATION=+